MLSRLFGTIALVTAAISLATPVLAYHAAPEWPDCYCTNRGERVEIGNTACLKVNGHSFLARCYMSLNNPAWRKLDESCEGLPISGFDNAPDLT